MANADLTADRLRELLHYDPETGAFTWRSNRTPRIRAGAVAGHRHPLGYWTLSVDGKRYYGHRLAWLHYYGEWPTNCVDHINGDGLDNRIANLRDITHKENIQNQRRAAKNNESSGILGVGWFEPRQKWRAQIGHDGRSIHLGYFDTADEARTYYLVAKRLLHKGCTI